MAKKLSGEQFVEKLRKKAANKPLLRRNYFVIVGQNTDDLEVEDTAITMVKDVTKRVMCSFSYDSNGLIYNMSFGGIGFVELDELITAIKEVLE